MPNGGTVRTAADAFLIMGRTTCQKDGQNAPPPDQRTDSPRDEAGSRSSQPENTAISVKLDAILAIAIGCDSKTGCKDRYGGS